MLTIKNSEQPHEEDQRKNLNYSYASIKKSTQLIALKKIVWTALILVTICSCASDKDDTSVSAPSDFYYPGETPIPFYTNGSVLPNIDWGNETGTFALDMNYSGVSLDETTGALSWNEDLPLGHNVVIVTATNSAGFATTTPNLLHQFNGVFNGSYNTDANPSSPTTISIAITFNVDGTMSVTDNGVTLNGTWMFDALGKLICTYTTFDLEFDLTYSLTVTPYLEGFKRNTGSATNLGFVRLDYQ